MALSRNSIYKAMREKRAASAHQVEATGKLTSNIKEAGQPAESVSRSEPKPVSDSPTAEVETISEQVEPAKPAAISVVLMKERRGPLSDPRSVELESRDVVQASFADAVHEVFAGTDFLHQQAKVNQLVRVRAEVDEHWMGMRDRFLSIGRALLDLEKILTQLEVERLRAGMEKLFPFSASVASQLKQVARSVREGRLNVADCPGSYSAAYQLTRLNAEQFQQAQEQGLVRPDVTRASLLSFRKSLGSPNHEPSVEDRRKELINEKDVLERRAAKLKERIDGIKAQIAALASQGSSRGKSGAKGAEETILHGDEEDGD